MASFGTDVVANMVKFLASRSRMVSAVVILSICCCAYGDDGRLPWHLPEWQFRQIVEVSGIGDSESGINTGLIELMAAPPNVAEDGRDIRVLDQNGKPVKHELIDSSGAALKGGLAKGEDLRIHFEIPQPPAQNYLVYFGNPDAQSTSEQWEKNLGALTLETLVNTQKRNAANWKEMCDLVAASKMKYGQGSRRQINDPENPFGPNEQYISIYKGSISCPVDGLYYFGVDSDDSSFLLINNQLVAQWPGGHNPSGQFDHAGSIELKAGIHKIAFYHVQTTGGTLARAGWKTPGSDAFITIPEGAFAQDVRTSIIALETRDQPVSAFFTTSHAGSIQFGSAGPSFVTVKFTDRTSASLSSIALREWNFGDGTRSLEDSPTHVFLGGATYDVTLRSTDGFGFESRYTRQIVAPARGETRVDVDMELASDSLVLLPQEPPSLQLRSRITGTRTLPLTLTTTYRAPDGALLSRQTEELAFAPDQWRTITRPEAGESAGLLANGGISFSLSYRGERVAESRVNIVSANQGIEGLELRDGRLVDASGAPLVLRLSDNPYRRRRASLGQRMARLGNLTIVVVDDSIAGLGDSSYLDILKERLQRLSKAKVTIERVGMDVGSRGYQPARNLVEFPLRAKELNADVVVIAASLRDVLRFIPVERFERNLQALVDRIEAESGAQVALLAPPPTIANPGLSQAYALAVKRVGLRRGLPVADIYSGFVKSGNGDETVWRELYRDPAGSAPVYHMSPTERGQELIADILFRTLTDQ